jgi:hypothetical protein
MFRGYIECLVFNQGVAGHDDLVVVRRRKAAAAVVS